MKRIVSDGPTPTSIDDENPLSGAIASMIASSKIHEFLDALLKQNFDCIVSTPRKGSWIIDDFLKRRNYTIEHLTTTEISNGPIKNFDISMDFISKKVLIFDDSVNTADTLINAAKNIGQCKELKLSCIIINDSAFKRLANVGFRREDIVYLKKFTDYRKYENNGYLSTTCQAYYYAHVLVPYIGLLTVNCSPDFSNLIVKLDCKNVKIDELSNAVIDTFKGIDGTTNGKVIIDVTSNTYRISKDLDPCYLEQLAENTRYDLDFCKIRISSSKYLNHSEMVITPMLCPLVDEELSSNPKEFLFEISKKFLQKYEKDILRSIEINVKCKLTARISKGLNDFLRFNE